jgi:predicted ribosomally synthesized peptide with nif11-like leader
MALESARDFLARLKADQKFLENLAGIASKKLRRDWIKAQGFDFSKKELEAATGELAPKELDRVVGGALSLQTPGVYINEINAFPNSVVPVATAIPEFVGYTVEDDEA